MSHGRWKMFWFLLVAIFRFIDVGERKNITTAMILWSDWWDDGPGNGERDCGDDDDDFYDDDANDDDDDDDDVNENMFRNRNKQWCFWESHWK